MTPASTGFSVGILFAASVALSFVHPWGNMRSSVPANTPIMSKSDLPPEIRRVLETKCVDCHSYDTRWPAYGRLVPVSWLIEHDVSEGRAHLNLSEWEQNSPDSQIDLLDRIASEARSGKMPLKQYLLLHPSARLTNTERDLIYSWAKAERKRIKNQIARQEKTEDTP